MLPLCLFPPPPLLLSPLPPANALGFKCVDSLSLAGIALQPLALIDFFLALKAIEHAIFPFNNFADSAVVRKTPRHIALQRGSKTKSKQQKKTIASYRLGPRRPKLPRGPPSAKLPFAENH